MKEITISCPFDASHKMPEPRLQWHILRCPKRSAMFHCKHSFKHHFLTKAARDRHQDECSLAPKRTLIDLECTSVDLTL